MTSLDIAFKRNAKPGKRFNFSNYCLTCGDPIPPNKDFCSDGCENDFYDDSALARDEDEELEELKREEIKWKSIP